jgi:hypothetical protein
MNNFQASELLVPICPEELYNIRNKKKEITPVRESMYKSNNQAAIKTWQKVRRGLMFNLRKCCSMLCIYELFHIS